MLQWVNTYYFTREQFDEEDGESMKNSKNNWFSINNMDNGTVKVNQYAVLKGLK